MQNINNDVPLYTYLPIQCEPYYYAILKQHGSWTDFGRVCAVHLARMLYDYQKFQIEIEQEDSLSKTGRIKSKICDGLLKCILSYCKLLKVDAISVNGPARDQVNKNRVKLRMVRSMESLKDDTLVAKPAKWKHK